MPLADLIRLHETSLFQRAYARSPRDVKRADRILFSFARRLRGADLDALDDPAISGIAGTAVSTNFSYPFAKNLRARHGRAVSIDWDNYEHPERLNSILAPLCPPLMEEAAVEPHIDWRGWFEREGWTLAWLLEHVHPTLYDLLEIPLRWELKNASRSALRLPRRNLFFHQGPFLKRSDVSIDAEFAKPRIRAARLTGSKAERVLGIIIDASAARYRELYGFQYPDAAHIYHADLGRGVDLFFFGVTPAQRLPLRAYHAGMYFKNGVPMGYIETLSLFEHAEVGFNLYYTFRDGETAWLYVRLLKFLREQLGVTVFSVDPYQLGHENEEAIESGAFWFYRKLGFRPVTKEIARLSGREEAKIAAHPGYRSPAAVLRRLSTAPLVYGDSNPLPLPKTEVNFPEEIRRAKRRPEETRYLRMLQRRPELKNLLTG